ncbi:MAG: hypothetical protein R6U98_35190 [Pirellulaceae bacterium]
MNYRGRVRDGVVVLDPGVQLPDGLEVAIEPLEPNAGPTSPSSFPGTVRNGVPVFPRSDSGVVPGLELVNQLRDESA